MITTRLEANWGVILHPLSRATNRKIFSSETPDRTQGVTSTTCGTTPLKNLFWLPVTGRRQNDWQRTNRSRNTNALPFDRCSAYVGYCDGMDVERIVDDIEQLQEMFEAPDIRPLGASDISAANRRHDEMLAHSPWFRLWQRYGLCCR